MDSFCATQAFRSTASAACSSRQTTCARTAKTNASSSPRSTTGWISHTISSSALRASWFGGYANDNCFTAEDAEDAKETQREKPTRRLLGTASDCYHWVPGAFSKGFAVPLRTSAPPSALVGLAGTPTTTASPQRTRRTQRKRRGKSQREDFWGTASGTATSGFPRHFPKPLLFLCGPLRPPSPLR